MIISVIVTEYKKRGYLIQALRSVFNQTLDKDKYEVVIVKKEEDKEVDDYAKKNGAKIIYSDSEKFGENIYTALSEAKGDIISLLNDDDIFTQDKLEEVYYIFKEGKVSEVRNEVIYIDSNNNILFNSTIIDNSYYKYFVGKYNYNHKKYFWMLGGDSCISIKREFIDDDIKYQNRIVDVYLTINALCKSEYEDVLFYGKPLTYYRVHSQNSSRPRALEEKIILTKNYLEDLERMYNKFYNCGKGVRKTLKFSLLSNKVLYYLFELYLTKDRKIEEDFKFSFSDKIFLFNPFNKPPQKSIIKYILASGFLLLPSSARFYLFKFLQKHSNIVNKILEI